MGQNLGDQRGCITVEGWQKGRHQETFRVVTECYCPNGHGLLSDRATFGGFTGISVKLRSDFQEGQLSLSPIIGDLSRTFFNFERIEGSIVEICCPTCDEPLPIYDQCSCGAFLATFFTTPKKDFANCIGICQRIGCLHSKIISIDNLRKYSRMGFY
jgi:hypothetical protein